jgi:hypothetical protein
MLNSKLYVSIIILFFLQCKTQFIINDTVSTNSSVNKKIALLDFYPFQVTQTYKSGRRASTTVGLNYQKSLKSYFPIGKPVDELLLNGYREDISEEKVKLFVTEYLKIARKSGIEEIIKLVDIKKKSETEFTYKLRNSQADYIVIGHLIPEFRKPNIVLVTLFTKLYSAFTLGTIPSYEGFDINPNFVLYDRNLNRIQEFTINSDYSVIQAWWANDDIGESGEKIYGDAGSTHLSKVFIPEIKKANNNIAHFINNLEK